MSTNPSHILIARNSRGPNNPSAALSSPTETHAAASGVFRSGSLSIGRATSPQWLVEEFDADDARDVFSGAEEQSEEVGLDATFTRGCRFPGTVKIVVENTTFWTHREILVFASPFFEAALSGDWSETAQANSKGKGKGRPQSISSVITISQCPSNPADKSSGHGDPAEMTITSVDREGDSDEHEHDRDHEDGEGRSSDFEEVSAHDGEESDADAEPAHKQIAREDSLDKLQGRKGRSPAGAPSKTAPTSLLRGKSTSQSQRKAPVADAIIVLKEEKANIFHDFLKFVYPHLECSITWNNVEGLMNISSKLCVPALTKHCIAFLLTHAAGKPIKAMRIAELFEDEQLYRESSRFVLDNPGGWSDSELTTLSQETLLKLEKRRTWFLERVLKLGLINVAKEYQCCNTCPDTGNCARLLDDKWRQAYNACFRFGPCQPSMVYRYLRGLEGVTPPLALTHLSCQATARAFTATLFDRMFSLGLPGSGTGSTNAVSLGARVTGAAPGPRRHFLYCSLKS